MVEWYRYRELIYNLAVKDLKVRYKTPVLGFLWILLNPLLQMMVLSILFTFVVRIQVANYPVFILTALIPWAFFSHSLSTSTSSIVENAPLIKKVWFPREVIPVSVNLANLVNFLLSLAVLFAFLAFWGIKPTLVILLLPLVIACQLIFNIGMSLLTAALHTYYRDVRYLVDAMLMVWFYLTPIFYPITMVPERFLPIYMLNPMAGIVTLYRDVLLYGRLPDSSILLSTIVMALMALFFGILMFRKYEPSFADLV